MFRIINFYFYILTSVVFSDTYINAIQACKQFLNDFNYESSKEMGREHRIKRKSNRLDSSLEVDQENETHVKYGDNSKIPPLPRLNLKSMTSQLSKYKSQNFKRNASSRIEIVASKKAKKASDILQYVRRNDSSRKNSVQNECRIKYFK